MKFAIFSLKSPPKMLDLLKGCVCYIFASLFCMSKREHLQNKEKRFLFHFKCSSRQSTFNILDIQMSWRHQMPRHETQNTYYWITWEVNTVWWWNLASSCNITKKKIFIKKYYKKCGLETSSRPFPIFKESSVKKIL